MNWFINSAWANNNVNNQSNPYSLLIMLAVFIVIFYFTVFRPQQKRNKNHRKLLCSISKGDEVLTNGGLVGRVVKIMDSGYICVVLNEKNHHVYHEVLIKLDCVTAILPKGTMKSL